jgi:hypothetical protein
MSVLSDWKDLQSLKILQTASVIQYSTSEIYSTSLANWLSINLNFQRKSREFRYFLDSPINDIS